MALNAEVIKDFILSEKCLTGIEFDSFVMKLDPRDAWKTSNELARAIFQRVRMIDKLNKEVEKFRPGFDEQMNHYRKAVESINDTQGSPEFARSIARAYELKTETELLEMDIIVRLAIVERLEREKAFLLAVCKSASALRKE